MEEDSEYELLPHKELEFLRNEVADMKKNPLGEKYESPDLISSVHKLTEVIEHMNDIFTSTNKEMMDDFLNGNTQVEEINKETKSVATENGTSIFTITPPEDSTALQIDAFELSPISSRQPAQASYGFSLNVFRFIF